MIFDLSFLIGVFVGAMVAWNLIPQPDFCKNLYEKMVEGVKTTIANITAKK